MTLIAALEGQDGLVLAPDSRGTIGDPRALTAINDTHKKIFQLSEFCGIATSGSAELNNRFIDYFITLISLFEKLRFYIFRCFTKTAVD